MLSFSHHLHKSASTNTFSFLDKHNVSDVKLLAAHFEMLLRRIYESNFSKEKRHPHKIFSHWLSSIASLPLAAQHGNAFNNPLLLVLCMGMLLSCQSLAELHFFFGVQRGESKLSLDEHALSKMRPWEEIRVFLSRLLLSAQTNGLPFSCLGSTSRNSRPHAIKVNGYYLTSSSRFAQASASHFSLCT